MKTINIKTIRIDGGTQSRVEINNEVVTEYSDAIKAGAEFPAVVVFNDGVDNWLADGFHRFHAHVHAGKTSINAEVRTGTARDAVLYILGANGTHGLKRTNADKRKAVLTALNDSEWSQWPHKKIAEVCSVSREYVSRLSVEMESSCDRSQDRTRTVERKGKTYEQDTSNIGVKQHHDAAKAQHEADISKGGTGAPYEADGAPDDAELQASIIRQEAEVKTMAFMLASDEPLADLAAKNTQLESQIKQLELRIAGLMNSNNEYIKRIKSLQNQLKKVQA